MDCKKICILLPAVRNVPNGGYKIIYDYANRLTNENMVLNICYASYFPNVQKGYSIWSNAYLTTCINKFIVKMLAANGLILTIISKKNMFGNILFQISLKLIFT